MAYPQNNTRIQITASSGQTLFNGPFKLFETADVKIYLTPVGQTPDPTIDLLTEGTNYTIAISGDGLSFTMTLINPATAGDIITMSLEIPNSRTTDFGYGGTFTGTIIDNQLDKITALISQVNNLIKNRGLLYPITDNLSSGQTTLPKLEANQAWKANGSGNLVGYEATTETCSTLRAELISQTPSAPGTDNVGYYNSALGGGTYLSDQLNALDEANKNGTTTGGPSIYLLALSLGLSSYYAGMVIYAKFNTTNNTSPKLNIDGLGNVSIINRDGSAVVSAYLNTSMYYQLFYDGVSFRIISQESGYQHITLPPNFNNITVSNYLATPHDIINGIGKCTDSTNTTAINVTTQLIKQIDSVWTEGSNVGGRASSVPLSTDTWYHYFCIWKSDGIYDFGFDTDLSATNLLADATGYIYFRRLLSIKTDGSSNILKFIETIVGTQKQVAFITPIQSVSMGVPDATAIPITLDVPIDVSVIADINLTISVPAGGGAFYLSRLDVDDTSPAITATGICVAGGNTWHHEKIITNTSAQARYRMMTSFPAGLTIYTLGWVE